MMTIKEFSRLCGCNTQTLRYYDRIDLLKPVKVDQWSGYRYYAESQAIDFVKIKNLQAADFSIEEIKNLLTKSDQQVYDAFNSKILEQTQKLARIREIQQSYLTEKNNMEKIIHSLSNFLLNNIRDYEGLREFGLAPEDGETIIAHVRAYLNKWLLRSVDAEQNMSLMVNGEITRGADKIAEKVSTLTPDNMADTILLGDESLSEKDIFDPQQYETLWETQGWEHVYEFLDSIPPMEQDGDYCFYFRLNEAKYRDDIAFPMFMLGAMVLRKGQSEVCMGCSVDKSDDVQNHFALMRRK